MTVARDFPERSVREPAVYVREGSVAVVPVLVKFMTNIVPVPTSEIVPVDMPFTQAMLKLLSRIEEWVTSSLK